MKANELRIGNLVYHQLSIIVEIIDSKKIHMEESVGGFYDPIPLTEEWLLRFGFFELNDSYAKEYNCRLDFKTYFDIGKWKDVWGIRDYDIEIKYVHQLQNLYFALTGEELSYEK